MRTPKRCLKHDSTRNFHREIDNIIMPDRNYLEISNITHIRFPAFSSTLRTQAHIPAVPNMVKERFSNKAS